MNDYVNQTSEVLKTSEVFSLKGELILIPKVHGKKFRLAASAEECKHQGDDP